MTIDVDSGGPDYSLAAVAPPLPPSRDYSEAAKRQQGFSIEDEGKEVDLHDMWEWQRHMKWRWVWSFVIVVAALVLACLI